MGQLLRDDLRASQKEKILLEKSHSNLRQDLQTKQEEIQSLQNEHQLLRDDLRSSQKEKILLDKSHSNLRQDLQTKQDVIDHLKHTHSEMAAAQSEMSSNISFAREELDRLRNVEKSATLSVKRLDTLINGIQERSRQRVLEKYGSDPHQVELTVQLPHSTSPKKITIELAPLSLMPHSVATFLDQVALKSWDGTHFDLHIGHALLGRAHIKQRDGDQPKFSMNLLQLYFQNIAIIFPMTSIQ